MDFSTFLFIYLLIFNEIISGYEIKDLQVLHSDRAHPIMRNTNFIKNEYYILKNSGVSGSSIFVEEEDIIRFIFLILHLQSPTIINNVGWYVSSYLKKRSFNINPKTVSMIARERQVALLSFKVTPSEFSLIVQNLEDGISSVYMQRVLTGYSRYFNSKYKKQGHVFQGPFVANRIKKQDLKKVISDNHKTEGEKMQYSSRDDYKNSKNNRWGDLLKILS